VYRGGEFFCFALFWIAAEEAPQHALHSLSYPFSASPEPREPDAFGLDVRGRLMLVDASRWEELVAKMAEVYV
jgi:protein BCP1